MNRIPLGRRLAVPLLLAGLTVAASSEANAAPCGDLPNPVYVAGSSAVKPVLKQVSEILGASDPEITLVYQSLGSCAGIDAIVNDTKITASARYWDAANGFTETSCELPASGATIDIGVSDVFPESCNYELGANQGDFLGPVQVMTLVAPRASKENSISAEAAYVVFGFGGQTHRVEPWTNEDYLIIRPDSSGTKAMIGAAIGLPPSKWNGAIQSGSGDVKNAVASSTLPDATIGILAADYADTNRDIMKILAFQHGGQSCGYLPDSTSTSFDKRNVRDGRYSIWGPLHLMANLDGEGKATPAAGNPSGPHVDQVIRLFTHDGISADKNELMIRAEANAFTVPMCAMNVTRDSEVGSPYAYEPVEPCGCFYESLKGGASDSCQSCDTNADCGGENPVCRFGFCEAR